MQEFLQPRFSGARFNEHTLPLELARDLVAYESLVVELAKALYLREHTERQRVPKGFAADFQLHIESVNTGSARPLLSVVAAGMLAFQADASDYFSRARDLITECIAAPVDKIPTEFPPSLLAYFNQIGRSLREGEQMEIEKPGKVAVLSPERRRELVLASGQMIEVEVEVSGTIGEVDWEKGTFRIRLEDGSFVLAPLLKSFDAKVRNYGGKQRHQVTLKGVGALDQSGKIGAIVWVKSLELQPDYQLATRFDELSILMDGWHDGSGFAPNPGGLVHIASKLIGHYPEHLPLPLIVATPDGGLLFEWQTSGDPSLDIDLGDLHADFHSFGLNNVEVEREFVLSGDAMWPEFLAFLSEHVIPSL